MDALTKRSITHLSNTSRAKKKSYFIFDKYCIIDKQVYERKKVGKEEIWQESEVDYLNVMNMAGIKKVSKKKTVDYLKSFNEVIKTYKEHGQISISNPFEMSEKRSENKKFVVKYYNLCFGEAGVKKDLSDFHILGQVIKELGQQNSIDVIFNAHYKNEDLSSRDRKYKKSAIQKNIIGSQRFLVFAGKLPPGVYQIVNIPITYFVKITKNGWNDFICGSKDELEKSKSAESAELESLSDLSEEISEEDEVFKCPLCDEVLPYPMPDKLKILFDQINEKKIYKSSLRDDDDKFPRDLIVDYENFCNIHAEEKLILKAREKNYPFKIKFDILNERICNFEKDLLNIILRKTDSFYFNLANQVYNEFGQKATMPMVLMNRADILRPGYYGIKGSIKITEILSEFFLKSNILNNSNSYPLNPKNYIQEILVPESATRLIFEDIGYIGSLEDARKIMNESSDFGYYWHSE